MSWASGAMSPVNQAPPGPTLSFECPMGAPIPATRRGAGDAPVITATIKTHFLSQTYISIRFLTFFLELAS